jgi:hypothetical protein
MTTTTQQVNALSQGSPQFEQALATWLAGAQQIIIDEHQRRNYVFQVAQLGVQRGQRYVKIVREDGSSRSVHAFIDATNGDVLKPASWKAPAKHARGNIYDEAHGLGSMGPYGPAYLK